MPLQLYAVVGIVALAAGIAAIVLAFRRRHRAQHALQHRVSTRGRIVERDLEFR